MGLIGHKLPFGTGQLAQVRSIQTNRHAGRRLLRTAYLKCKYACNKYNDSKPLEASTKQLLWVQSVMSYKNLGGLDYFYGHYADVGALPVRWRVSHNEACGGAHKCSNCATCHPASLTATIDVLKIHGPPEADFAEHPNTLTACARGMQLVGNISVPQRAQDRSARSS